MPESAYKVENLIQCPGCGEYDEVIAVDGCITFKDRTFHIEWAVGDAFLKCACGNLSKEAGTKAVQRARYLGSLEDTE